jgi:polysaccharide pyruvyl transferase WcaK-like protein
MDRSYERGVPSRRGLLAGAAASAVSAAWACAHAAVPKTQRILLRSGWQTINIGDIAHTPGMLHLLERHVPGVEVWLCPSRVDDGVSEMLAARFPRVRILDRERDLAEAFAACDFLLHGSGPFLVAAKDVRAWRETTGKPYGIYGITLDPSFLPDGATSTRPPDQALSEMINLLSAAAFVFFRDTASLAVAKEKGCTCQVMDFGPDAAFATDLRADAAAERFLAAHDLEPGRFLCCIPRYRYTPYWRLPGREQAADPMRHARNEEFKEHDHAPHRQAIVRVIRETGMKVLICPEDRTQMEIGREMLLEPLPEDVKRDVVWRPDFWLPDEALSTYVRSAGLFGNEMHSPIMAVGNGVPAVVCRWREQTNKGLMWRDIGLGDWLFDMDDATDVARVVPTVLAMATNRDEAREKVRAARRLVEKRQRETMETLRGCLN